MAESASPFPESALEILELSAALTWIAESAVTPAGRRAVLGARPGDDAVLVERRRACGQEASLALEGDVAPALARGGDLLALAARAARNGLEGRELAELADSLGLLLELRRWAARHEEYPALGAVLVGAPDLAPIAELLRRTVDARGEVRDEADEGLAAVRAALREHARRRARRVDHAAEEWGGRGWLQSRRPVQRAGRLLLAVKASHQGRAKGIVHDRSRSGDTLFVEPAAAVEISNRLAADAAREARLVQRVLGEASRAVARARPELEAADAAIGAVDAALAAARWAREHGAAWPDHPAPALLLHEARHPLLVRALGTGGVVPLDLSLGVDFDLLVVTGPNTGGKTVVLKTAGLLAALACAGLPVTAGEGSAFPALAGIDADIGDQQSLETSLSTFSGHLKRVLRILRRSEHGALVLLDELGTGTDPEEGAALGQAILETLLARGCLVLASTHLGSLKMFSVRVARAENASMEFDPESLAPRYRLLVGVPGASHALEVAETLGLDAALLARARALTDRGGQAEALLAEVAGVRREAERMRERARSAESDARETLRAAAADAEQRLSSLELREEEMRHAYRDVLAGIERVLENQGRALGQRLSGAEREDLDGLCAGVRAALAENDLGERWQAFLKGIRKGDVVYVPRYRERLRVLRVDARRQRLKVRHGQLEIEVPFHEISWVTPPPGAPGAGPP